MSKDGSHAMLTLESLSDLVKVGDVVLNRGDANPHTFMVWDAPTSRDT